MSLTMERKAEHRGQVNVLVSPGTRIGLSHPAQAVSSYAEGDAMVPSAAFYLLAQPNIQRLWPPSSSNPFSRA